MTIVNSLNKVPIRLTKERWEHIINRHPEMITEKDKLLENIKEPDFIQEGDYGTLMAIKYTSYI